MTKRTPTSRRPQLEALEERLALSSVFQGATDNADYLEISRAGSGQAKVKVWRNTTNPVNSEGNYSRPPDSTWTANGDAEIHAANGNDVIVLMDTTYDYQVLIDGDGDSDTLRAGPLMGENVRVTGTNAGLFENVGFQHVENVQGRRSPGRRRCRRRASRTRRRR